MDDGSSRNTGFGITPCFHLFGADLEKEGAPRDLGPVSLSLLIQSTASLLPYLPPPPPSSRQLRRLTRHFPFVKKVSVKVVGNRCSSHLLPSSVMAPSDPQSHQQQCAKYQYVVTAAGPKIVPVPQEVDCRDEESAADYNSGGYLAIKVTDTFKDGRYVVLRKLGCVAYMTLTLLFIVNPLHLTAGAISRPCG